MAGQTTNKPSSSSPWSGSCAQTTGPTGEASIMEMARYAAPSGHLPTTCPCLLYFYNKLQQTNLCTFYNLTTCCPQDTSATNKFVMREMGALFTISFLAVFYCTQKRLMKHLLAHFCCRMMWVQKSRSTAGIGQKRISHGNILIIVCFDSWLIAEGDHWAGIKV